MNTNKDTALNLAIETYNRQLRENIRAIRIMQDLDQILDNGHLSYGQPNKLTPVGAYFDDAVQVTIAG